MAKISDHGTIPSLIRAKFKSGLRFCPVLDLHGLRVTAEFRQTQGTSRGVTADQRSAQKNHRFACPRSILRESLDAGAAWRLAKRSSSGKAKPVLEPSTQPGRPGTQSSRKRRQRAFLKSR